ncbi:MAG: hypothetical protein ACXVPU_07105 [Bacteroidia bacterium]
MPFTIDDLKIWAPVAASIVVVAVSIAGQYMIFRLNKRKDIRIKVAELYGRFKALGMQFNMTFYEYNYHNLYVKRFDKIYLHHSHMADDVNYIRPSELNTFEIDHVEAREHAKKKSNYHNKNFEEKFWQHKKEKFEILEILHQIHFYYNDKKLDEYIDDFTAIKLLPFVLEEYNENLEIEKEFNRYSQAYINGQIEECKNIFKKLSEKMLNLS